MKVWYVHVRDFNLMWNTDYMECAPQFQPVLSSINRLLAEGFFLRDRSDEMVLAE